MNEIGTVSIAIPHSPKLDVRCSAQDTRDAVFPIGVSARDELSNRPSTFSHCIIRLLLYLRISIQYSDKARHELCPSPDMANH